MIAQASDHKPVSDDVGRLGLLLGLIVGAALRLWNLTLSSQHTDEAFTFALSALPVPALVHNVVIHDFHPPLFYLLTHYLMVWIPKPQWDYRYLTALFGCLTIIATWGAARRMFGPLTAAIAALCVALAPALVQHDRIYRMYAVTVALGTLAWWLLLEIEQAAGRRRIVLALTYVVVAVSLPLVDYFGILILAAQGVYALTRRAALAPALLAIGVAFVAFVPWIGALREQLPLAGVSLSRPAFDIGLANSIAGAFAAGTPSQWFGWPGGALAPLVVVISLMLAGAWLGRRSALPFWLSILAMQVAASVLVGKNLAYFPRYLLVDIPPVFIAVGLVVSTLAAAHLRVLAAALGAALLAFFGFTVSNVVFDPFYQFPDWYAVNALMLAHEEPADAIVLDAGYEGLVVHNYTAFRGHTTLAFMNPADFDSILSWIAQHPNRRIWYVEHQHFYWDAKRRIASALGTRRRTLVSKQWPHRLAVDDVTVTLFDKAPSLPMTRVR
ncbi:MAG TPA: glycosyltransferase family 39 protein [Candidatus Acidoferrales bacterium]|nr:glycosyltransferase family 39 protein [Candidatus Acidoferrales bacterium]